MVATRQKTKDSTPKVDHQDEVDFAISKIETSDLLTTVGSKAEEKLPTCSFEKSSGPYLSRLRRGSRLCHGIPSETQINVLHSSLAKEQVDQRNDMKGKEKTKFTRFDHWRDEQLSYDFCTLNIV